MIGTALPTLHHLGRALGARGEVLPHSLPRVAGAARALRRRAAVATLMSSLLSPRETSVVRVDTDHATIEVEHLYGYDDAAWRLTPLAGH